MSLQHFGKQFAKKYFLKAVKRVGGGGSKHGKCRSIWQLSGGVERKKRGEGSLAVSSPLLHLAVKSESQKRTKKVFSQPEKPHVCCTHPSVHPTQPTHTWHYATPYSSSISWLTAQVKSSSRRRSSSNAYSVAKYSRDAAPKCMKIHMVRDKYIMGNNRLSRASKI